MFNLVAGCDQIMSREQISSNLVLICAGINIVSGHKRSTACYSLSCLCGYKLTAI